MTIGYLDCFSGISGDMLLGAAVDAGVSLEAIKEVLAGLPFSGYELQAAQVTRNELAATKVDVRITDEDVEHRGLFDVLSILHAGNIPGDIREEAEGVFRALAEAEGAVHDIPPDQVHFHEVGAIDAICDVVGGIAGLHELGIDELFCSTVALGGGTVQADHGTLPVPAPATVRLLQDIPARGGPVERELTTPTGAALLNVLASPTPFWPDMTTEKLGSGAGGHDIEGHPNVLRLAVGSPSAENRADGDTVAVLEATIDDMTGEELGYAMEVLLDRGALDAWCAPVQMKKGRQGTCLTVLCEPGDMDRVEDLLWKHTTTLGFRYQMVHRRTLQRSLEEVETRWGTVQVKVAGPADDPLRCKPEYEDCRRIAEQEGLSLRRVRDEARRAWQAARAQRSSS
ncbi:MAG: nickel pincer cofactor biosynthesis protein LarC [Planctomycetota bacterium]